MDGRAAGAVHDVAAVGHFDPGLHPVEGMEQVQNAFRQEEGEQERAGDEQGVAHVFKIAPSEFI